MDGDIIRVDYVPQSNVNQVESIYNSQIVCTDDWIIAYAHAEDITQEILHNGRFYFVENQSPGCLYKFSFIDQTWRVLPCQNLPKFLHLSMLLLNQRHLVIHGTTVEERHIYKTYIGDLTQRDEIIFDYKASLTTPVYLEYGEQMITTDNVFLYALTGRKINRPRVASVFRLDLGIRYEWTSLYEEAFRIFPRTYYVPSVGQNIVYYDHQIFVFPSTWSNDVTALSVFDLRRTTAWRRAETTYGGRPDMGPYSPDRVGVEYSVAQCPVEPRHVYVQMVNQSDGQVWTVWRLDLDTLRWTSPLRVHGPLLTEVAFDREMGAAITPSGRMYALRLLWPLDRVGLLSASVRAPRLVDRAFEAVVDLLRRARAAGHLIGRVAGRDPRSVFSQLPPTLSRRLWDP